MTRRSGLIAGGLAALGVLAGLAAVGAVLAGQSRTFLLAHEPVMGSGFNATAVFPRYRAGGAPAALASALRAALDLEKKISKYDAASEVRRAWELPPGGSLPVSGDTFRALDLSKQLWQRSGGAFDCTVQPLIELYKYTGKEERMPTDAELSAARGKVGSDKLLLDPEKRAVAFAMPGMKFDLGAVGQGLGADLACEALQKAGASGALVELGGEVRAFGRKPGGAPWRVAIVHPREAGRTMAVVELDGNAASTSGDYEKYFLTAGGAAPAPADNRLTTAPRMRRASHILDPRTGKPLIGGAVSVTVIAPDCILADGLATAVSVLGPVEGMKLVESYRAAVGSKQWAAGNDLQPTAYSLQPTGAVEALIIEETADGRLVPHFSPGLKDRLKVDLEVPVANPAAASQP